MPRSPGGPCPRSRSRQLPFLDVALRGSSQPGPRWTTRALNGRRPRLRLLQGRWLSHRLPPPYPGGPMCGIVAVLRRSSGRMPPDGAHLLAELEQAVAALAVGGADQEIAGPEVLTPVAERVEAVDALLHGAPGVRALLADRALAVGVEHHVEQLQLAADRVEHALDASAADLSTVELEDVNAALVRFKDTVWAVGHDRLRTARAVADLCGSDLAPSAIEAFTSVQVALSALDRLEVRGRDSAGLHVFVHHHAL